ncbi:lysine--tRNA ligase [Allobranchiibius huperziae]|uniref:Lysine--tRNA ligase n=1 Tax=Allobranchiibius huperziae TaxID=1874116 RepID=A0A853DH06_9MICO|nr:lysyl-tRNA synthetase class 1 [Allobranchiibius huperziae]
MTERLDDWVSRLADEVIEEAERRDTKVVCASGLSPSGPIHLGNLREVMTPHLVADEVKRRGVECEHIISWDDYDRFRKVPNYPGVDDSWAQHIGKPLTSVPPPSGSPYTSWAEHFRAQCEEGLAQLGIVYRGISQTEQYTSGAYTDQVLFAMSHRDRIDEVLDQYRTLAATDDPKPAQQKQQQKISEDDAAAVAEAEAGSGAAAEDDGSSGSGYFPYRPYSATTGTDETTVTAYDDATGSLTYRSDGDEHTIDLHTEHHGKLVWKVDWPMRWAYEKVVFEPSGVDHQSPGSSYVVGKDLAPVFGWERPIGPMYAFVGMKGMAKMSSSRGGVPTPSDAMQIMEPALLRWLYARRRPNQSFSVAFDADVQRMYDEWDALCRKVAGGKGQPGDVAAWTRATSTAEGVLTQTPVPVAYRTLASIVDITTGDEEQTLRIVAQLDPSQQVRSLDDLRPRLDCVEHWVATQMPSSDRTVVRGEPDLDHLATLTDQERDAVRILLEGNGADLGRLEDGWSLDTLTHQVYGVPKVQRGLAADQIVKGDKELGAAQRAFFTLLYNLLISRDTGPRLPTLLLAIGPERVRALLAP